ncbi:hypothetical protein QFC21_000250 [Naganishia friedmannii]|uniref:Uncharacterized protein n=1 Tax=Naganishia friedmannii TaxID=89922 RepID=A0ACC2WBS2_9TREE|nr:hypothetical protein QFC21_000250 [Naganishia friedmannii]
MALGAASATAALREMDAVEEPETRPQLSESEIKTVKKELRALQKQAEDDNTDASKMTAQDLANKIAVSNGLFSRLKFAQKNSSLAVIDSRIMAMHSETAMKIGKQARAEANAFEPGDFFEPLRDMLGLGAQMLEDMDVDEDEAVPNVRHGGKLGDWAKIGWLAVRRSKRAPGVEFMNGMMAIEHKKRIVNRKARQRQAAGPEVRPQEIRQEDMTKAANPTITNTKALTVLLEKQDGEVNFFEWVVNPRSFGQTVENMFYTSFLVREGIAAIDVKDDGSGIPMISYDIQGEERPDSSGFPAIPVVSCDPPSEEDKKAQYDEEGNVTREALTRRQVVMEMTMDVWQEAIELFNIAKGIIPHREEAEEQKPSASGWYA